MSTATDIKIVIDKVINDYGSTVYIDTYGTVTYDKWSDETYGTALNHTQIKAVPIGYFKSRITSQLWGEHSGADCVLIMKADDSVFTSDFVNWRNQDYIVKEIKEIPLQDIVLAKRLELGKRNP